MVRGATRIVCGICPEWHVHQSLLLVHCHFFLSPPLLRGAVLLLLLVVVVVVIMVGSDRCQPASGH
jgi:hypothetical protein